MQLHGADTIAAVIVDRSVSTGVLPPPVDYLRRLREITTRYGILLIFDEVITGFGRLGTPFASHYFGVVPDLMTTAKGLTNGALPMGAVFANRVVHDAMMTGPEPAIELFHGYTYSGHPSPARQVLRRSTFICATVADRVAGIGRSGRRMFELSIAPCHRCPNDWADRRDRTGLSRRRARRAWLRRVHAMF